MLLFKFETNYKEMKIKLLLAALMIGCVTCSKDTFNTAPSLKFISVNGSVFPQPSSVNFKLEFTDKEGDISDTLWVQRVSIAAACASDNLSFVDSIPIPDIGSTHNVKGEFDINFVYPPDMFGNPDLRACSLNDDTSYFRFWMHDKALHVSDTVQSPNIVLLKQ
jgi:hypothetical protein